MTSIY